MLNPGGNRAGQSDVFRSGSAAETREVRGRLGGPGVWHGRHLPAHGRVAETLERYIDRLYDL